MKYILSFISFLKFLYHYLRRFIFLKLPSFAQGKTGRAKAYLNELRPYKFEFSNIIRRTETLYDVSVIIPVYNCEKYLRKCLDSVLNQKTKYNFEVIAVNDGSDDGSLDILQEYSSYPNLTIMNKSNGGASSARNVGLENASGQYFIFVDSDDYIEPGTIELLMNVAIETGADIVQGGLRIFPEEKLIVRENKTIINNCNQENYHCSGYFCDKMFKREMFNDVFFPEGLLYEDTILHMIILPFATKIVWIDSVIYNYRMNPDSVMHTQYDNNRNIDSVWIVCAIFEMWKQMGIKLDDHLYKFLLFQMCVPTLDRMIHCENVVKENAFCVFSSLIQQSGYKCDILNKNQQLLEKALCEGRYKAWIECYKLHKYSYDLHSF